MSEFIDLEQEAKKDTRRAWKLMIVAVALVFGLFVGLMLFYDCPPPDDSSIMPRFTESPGGYNPLAVFLEELEAHPLWGLQQELSPEALIREKGSEDETKAYLAKHTALFQAFDRLMQTEPAKWRWPGREGKVSPECKGDTKISALYLMLSLLDLKTHIDSVEGRMDAAVTLSLQRIKFGRGLESAEGPLLNYRLALEYGADGKLCLEKALVCGNADPVGLNHLQDELRSLESNKMDLVTTLKMEYLFLTNEMKAFKHGRIETIDFRDPHPGMKGLFLKPNLYQTTLRNYTKRVIAGFTVSWKEGWLASQKVNRQFNLAQEDGIRFWGNPNVYGNVLLKKSMRFVPTEYEYALYNVTITRLTVLMLAMRRYELEQGKLPESLEALVPKYVSAVPVDPFHEVPMRWNPSRRQIYSVGQDGIDGGGGMRHAKYFGSHPDICLLYWWSEEAKAERASE